MIKHWLGAFTFLCRLLKISEGFREKKFYFAYRLHVVGRRLRSARAESYDRKFMCNKTATEATKICVALRVRPLLRVEMRKQSAI